MVRKGLLTGAMNAMAILRTRMASSTLVSHPACAPNALTYRREPAYTSAVRHQWWVHANMRAYREEHSSVSIELLRDIRVIPSRSLQCIRDRQSKDDGFEYNLSEVSTPRDRVSRVYITYARQPDPCKIHTRYKQAGLERSVVKYSTYDGHQPRERTHVFSTYDMT